MAARNDTKGKAARPASAQVVDGWYVTPNGDRTPSYVRSLTHFRFADAALEAAFVSQGQRSGRAAEVSLGVVMVLLTSILLSGWDSSSVLGWHQRAVEFKLALALHAGALFSPVAFMQDKFTGTTLAAALAIGANALASALPLWAVLLVSLALQAVAFRASTLLWFDRLAVSLVWLVAIVAPGAQALCSWPALLLFLAVYLASVAIQAFLAFAAELSARARFYSEWALQHNAPSLSKQQLPFLMHQGNPGCMPDEDASLLPQLKGIHFQPVFISGVHRSGTSFLYKALSDVLPVAYLRMFDIVNYNRLLAAYKAGTIAEEAAAIDAYLAAVGLKSRLIDSVEASHAAAEEHGFVLMAHSRRGTNYLCTANSQLFSEMCAKLVVVQACPSGVVLMKNPFDHGREAEIARLYPNAKFIHIQRDLAACLSSFISIMDVMWPQVGGIDPWIYSLLSGCQYIFAVFILLDLIVGHQRTMYQVARNLVATTLAIKASAARAFTEIRAREPHRVHDLTYEQLMVDPEGEVGRIAAFLGLEPNATELARLGGRVAPRASRLHPSITEAMEAHAAADTGRVADRSELSAWTTIKSLVPVMAPGDALRAVKRWVGNDARPPGGVAAPVR